MRAEMEVYASLLKEGSILAHRALFQGSVAGRAVAVLHTDMGLTNTAVALLAALDALDPALVLSQGTAGAHVEDLHVGDIVCADSFVYGDSRKGDELLPVETLDGMVTSLPAHQKFIEIGKKYGLPLGPVTSGYAWNTDPAVIRARHAQTGSLCEEMEDAAAAQICAERGLPHGSLRVISNNHLRADGGYDVTVAERLQRFILHLIESGDLA